MTLRKQVHVLASLRYGMRLTQAHFKTLVPGSALYFLPDLFNALQLPLPGPALAWRLAKAVVALILLWHALDLADAETKVERARTRRNALKQSGNFFGSMGLYWVVLLALASLALPWVCGIDWACLRQQFDLVLDGQFPAGLSGGTLLGVGLTLVPCGLWALYGWFHGYYVADEGQGPWQSMRSSYAAVRGAELGVLLFCLVCGVLNILGLALAVVGIFFAFPITLLATTYVHLELKQQTLVGDRL